MFKFAIFAICSNLEKCSHRDKLNWVLCEKSQSPDLEYCDREFQVREEF